MSSILGLWEVDVRRLWQARSIQEINEGDPLENIPGPESIATTPPSELNLKDFEERFPGIIQDGVLDAAGLGAILGIEVSAPKDAKQRFGLMWAGKQEAIQALMSPSLATLKPDLGDSIAWETAENIFIEGDNLEVLKLLQNAYNDRVKIIYIDPPYNTGKDFVYKDDFSDPIKHYLKVTGQVDSEGNQLVANTEISGRKHSNWLNMMYPRLYLGRNLLTEDGVIFVSIDDHEFHNLRLLMDEIFGSENFVGVIKRRASRKTAFLAKTMTDMCDYVVIYSRGDLAEPLSAGEISDGSRPVIQKGNKVTIRTIRAGVLAKCQDGTYSTAGNQEVKYLSPMVIEDGKVKSDIQVEAPWRVSQEILDQTVFVTRTSGFRRTMMESELGKSKLLNDLLDDPTCYNEAGSESLASLIGKGIFDHPKPVGLIKHLVSSISDKNAIVLDFFAGSGTTFQAVAELNLVDGGNRKTISITLGEATPEDSEARKNGFTSVPQITKLRMKKVMQELPAESNMGLRSMKLGPSFFLSEHDTQREEELQFRENTLIEDFDFHGVVTQMLLNVGVPLSTSWELGKLVGFSSVFADGVLCIPERKLDSSLTSQVLEVKPRLVLFLEDAFSGKDDLKANIYFACKKANIAFKTF
jgi:adenine-specific DNA-methyltransferase